MTLDALQYHRAWVDLNRELNEIGRDGLGVALHALYRQQLENGFIRDDLSGLQRRVFRHPQDDQRFFSAQYNPGRAKRFAGSGVVNPPPGSRRVNNGCFLCPENVLWQQQGAEMGFDILLDGRSYIAWMNPYPLLPEHAVIASREHVAQAWRGSGEQPGGRSLAIIVADLLKLASRLPGWIGFYNGPDAGASIPHHFHYQFFPRPAGCPVYPLEQAAARRFAGQSVPTYPLEFAHWRGDAGTVSRTATRRIQLWADHPPDGVSAPTANFIASAGNDGALDLYFVPRDRIRARSPGMSGLVGGLETLGELVFSSEEEQQRLRSGDIDFEEIERMLAHVSTPL